MNRELYRLRSAAFNNTEVEYAEHKGRVRGLEWLLGKLEDLEAETKELKHEEETEEEYA